MSPLQLVKVPASDGSIITHFLRNLQIKRAFYQQIIELASLFAGRRLRYWSISRTTEHRTSLGKMSKYRRLSTGSVRAAVWAG
jgi:hypothetical protein